MGRSIAALMIVSLVVASCATDGDAADDGGATTSTATPTSTTSSIPAVETTTTTEADPCQGEPFSLDGRGSRLIPGCVHRTDDFGPTPVLFSTDDDWWLTVADGDPRLVKLGVDSDRDGGLDASLAFVVWSSGLGSVQLLAELDAVEGVDQDASPLETMVGRVSALTADYQGQEDDAFTGFRTCSTSGVEFDSDEPGYQLITYGDRRDIGFPACNRTRVWTVELSDETILVLAAAHDPDRFEEFMPIFEEFLENNVTFGDPDG